MTLYDAEWSSVSIHALCMQMQTNLLAFEKRVVGEGEELGP
jgi:hypothetical protein